MSLLSDQVSATWKDRIKVKSDWFSCIYKYVQSVDVLEGEVQFNFGSGKDAEYMVQARVRNCETGQIHMSDKKRMHLGAKLVLTRADIHIRNYEVELYIDSHLAYKKILLTDDVPF